MQQVQWYYTVPESSPQLDIFTENGKTQLFNSWGVGEWAYFQKKWSVPLSFNPWAWTIQFVYAPAGHIIENKNIAYHSCANDTQIYLDISPSGLSPSLPVPVHK